MTGIQEKSTNQRRRSGGGGRSTNAWGSSSGGSSRGARQPADQALAELEPMISALIKENRELHRQIDRLSRQTVGAASGPTERALRSLERRVRGSLDGHT